ncbi:MAG: endonuclease/exonuclease/phosphatase family protein [Alistipes sp.]|jgi:hypothetical protein|nr:endonuclease/exonuclease/phosphatase family protein [Alistipes sp.]
MNLKRFIALTVLIALGAVAAATTMAQNRNGEQAQNGERPKPSRNTVMFYNVENVFDTIPDPDTDDTEFIPDGNKRWNSHKYGVKMANLEKVFFGVAAAVKDFPTVIGLSEIENRSVVEDMAALERLAPARYRIVHFDSPDLRGVDVGFMYRADRFTLEGSETHAVVMPDMPDWRTRDIVAMWGTMEGEPFYFMVCHWPSRNGGQAASAPRRERAAEVARGVIDSLHRLDPAIKVMIMGDLNDDPTDPSVEEVLGGKGRTRDLVAGDMFNPYYEVFRSGQGTLAYRDGWNLFDNIVVSENLVNAPEDSWRLTKMDGNRFCGNIFRASWLFQKEGQFKGYPLRTYVGNNFQSGYSDHLPVYVVIEK